VALDFITDAEALSTSRAGGLLKLDTFSALVSLAGELNAEMHDSGFGEDDEVALELMRDWRTFVRSLATFGDSL